MTSLIIYGIVSISFGILYLMKPMMFYGGIWKRTHRAAREKSPKEYKKYMQKTAVFLIGIGLILLIIGLINTK